MSDQAEQTSGETGSTGAGPSIPNSSVSRPDAADPAQVNAEAASLVPDAAPEANAPKPDSATPAAKETVQPEAPRQPGKLLIMAAADRDWRREEAASQPQSGPEQGMFGKRRFGALAAVVALAAIAGALGGAMATVSLQHFAGHDAVVAPSDHPGLEASVGRIDADIVALKAGVEHTSKMAMSQFNKTSDRLDKLEKAQAESSAKLAKLGEAVEKLHATPSQPVAAAPQAAPKDVTGSIATPAAPAQAAAVAAPRIEARTEIKAEVKPDAKPEIGRLPIIDSWVLQDVGHGGALIEGRQGVFEVYAGDVVPGLGRIDAVRRQDGRWVVVTSRGLIVAR